MIRKFASDRRGNFAMMMTIAVIPIMGGLALAVDYSELSRQRQVTLNALDAAGVATARYIVNGGVSTADPAAYETAIKKYSQDFFEANLGPVDPSKTALSIVLPSNTAGGGTLKLTAELKYEPYFLPTFAALIGRSTSPTEMDIEAVSEVRLKNTLEVALVLDNSGSMEYLGSGSGQKRIDLLKAAAKQLVETLSQQASQMQQLQKPVQFALVPFAASVNVGPENAGEGWMDTSGTSPVHHENFNWTTLSPTTSPDKYAQWTVDAWYKRGSGWGETEDLPLTRFSLYKDVTTVTARERVRKFVCEKWRSNGTCEKGETRQVWEDTDWGPFADWQGCVETRPAPYNYSDEPASTATPETLFVPMFAPDEPGERWDLPSNYNSPRAYNNWWNDDDASTTHKQRQANMRKYLEIRPYGAQVTEGKGPNLSCTTTAITPLQDITTLVGKTTVTQAIDDMEPLGGTNVPEGMAWGWRTVSSGAPFTQARPEIEKGNDKVVIVLTDGENTYYTPGSLGSLDPAGNRSTYSAFGYTNVNYPGAGTTRLFMDTEDIDESDFSNANYTDALNEQFDMLCDNAKANNILILTVALDLDESNDAQEDQIDALRTCSSDSRFRKDPNDPTKPAKLFWNATGSNLAAKFKEIADELSNLRIVG